MLADPMVSWILCEWHTDVVRGKADGRHELFSIKHREADSGPWRLSDICSRGGLATLMKRWHEAGRVNPCAIVTNAGLATGRNELRQLANLLADQDAGDRRTRLGYFAERLEPMLRGDRESCLEFLCSAQVISPPGDRFTIRSLIIEEVARPLLRGLGVSVAHARDLFDCAYELVTEAMRGFDFDDPPDTWMTAGFMMHAEEVRARTITRERLIARCSDRGIPLVAGHRFQASTQMMRKLRAGHLGPTVLSTAPRMRQEWYELEAAFRDEVASGISSEIARLRNTVMLHAQAVESELAGSEQYGRAMHSQLIARTAGLAQSARLPIDDYHIAGLVYQLTDECAIWWSEEFDARHEAPWAEVAPKGVVEDE